MDQLKVKSLFKNSSFIILKKEEYELTENQNILSKLKFKNDIQKFHIDRRKEYELVRIAIHKILKEEFQFELTEFESTDDRAPVWPSSFSGSITHSKDLVMVAISKNVNGIGIDLENLGRMKKEIGRHILHEKDILQVDGLTEEQVLTIIFSAKEALYKALYPKVKKFFGFDSAYISKIDLSNSQFQIHLAKDLNNDINKSSIPFLIGRFYLNDSHCLAIIEY